jgi:3-polyprenyl-4-hydroxybenzoate decarboxylase
VNHLRSLRAFIDALDTIGELQPVDKEVDWRLEHVLDHWEAYGFKSVKE